MPKLADILAKRLILQAGADVEQLLAHWTTGRVKDATWEDASILREQFPDFSLEDKAYVQEGVSLVQRWKRVRT